MHDDVKASFEERVLTALDDFCLKVPPGGGKIAVSAFLKQVAISKSSLYADHKHLLPVIRYRLESIGRRDEDALKKARGPSRREAIEERQNFKKNLSKLASSKLTRALKDLGPSFRERNQLAMEIREKDKKIKQLENTVINQQEMLHDIIRIPTGES